MQPLEVLEQELFDYGIDLFCHEINGLKALAIKINNKLGIAIDNSLISSSYEKREILLHEYYHLKEPKYMYDFDTSDRAVAVREGKIKRKLFFEILPLSVLLSFIERKIPSWEIAEELCMTEQFVLDAFNYYKEKGVIKSANLQD